MYWMLRRTILKKISISFLVDFCLSKYDFSIDTSKKSMAFLFLEQIA